MSGRGRGSYYKEKNGRKRKSEQLDEMGEALHAMAAAVGKELGNKNRRTFEQLRQTLNSLERANWSALKTIKGTYEHGSFSLYIDHVQSDPFAAPSKLRVRMQQRIAKYPKDLYVTRIRNIALVDYLTRRFWETVHKLGLDRREGGQGWHGAKGGDFNIDKPGQEVLQRSSIAVNKDWIEVRFTFGMPGRGRSIMGKSAAELLVDKLSQVVIGCLPYAAQDHKPMLEHIHSVEDQEWLREQLANKGLIAFVRDGAELPRASGASDLPMVGPGVVPFRSPESLRVSFDLPHNGKITGMGIPRGVVLITGGGFHGKSTLLQALEMGVYNHIPGDGRDFVCTDVSTVKIRTEDGRYVCATDITPFINGLPHGKETRRFHTLDASGSTSMAANIQEALEIGATGLLFDEDTSATNFLVRDARMQRLISKDHEPITPLISKVQIMLNTMNIACILVIGGCGDYLDVADLVIEMHEYVPKDVTREAKQISRDLPTKLIAEGGVTYGSVTPRKPFIPPPGNKNPKTHAKYSIGYAGTELSLHALEQLVSSSQTRCIADTLAYVSTKIPDARNMTLSEIADFMDRVWDREDRALEGTHPSANNNNSTATPGGSGKSPGVNKKMNSNSRSPNAGGLVAVNPEGFVVGYYARPRKYELIAAINRLRCARMIQTDGNEDEFMTMERNGDREDVNMEG
ncbi:uncharacterized protein VTP21DRAFT_8863 [Calcarisporiella thermophila]|uniref:uncharacterized protein n=1 Tax=Calcarisporiella thermophila TaxID=911321 RepID=UPI003743B832